MLKPIFISNQDVVLKKSGSQQDIILSLRTANYRMFRPQP